MGNSKVFDWCSATSRGVDFWSGSLTSITTWFGTLYENGDPKPHSLTQVTTTYVSGVTTNRVGGGAGGGGGPAVRDRICALAPDGRTMGLNLAIGVFGGVSVSAEVVFDYHTGQVTLVVSGGFGPSGAAAQIGGSTGFIWGEGDSVPNYASGGNTTVSATLPSGLGISTTANSGGLTGNPVVVKAITATAVQVGYSLGMISLLGGFGAFAQNTIQQIPIGSVTTGLGLLLATPVDAALYGAQQMCH